MSPTSYSHCFRSLFSAVSGHSLSQFFDGRSRRQVAGNLAFDFVVTVHHRGVVAAAEGCADALVTEAG